MTLSALIRRTIVQWSLWRSHRETRRAIPQLAAIDKRRTECRRHHRRGAAALDLEAKRITTAALAEKRVQ
ncbi:hypothetical protein NKJ52_20870 [Mesorhizobium australicum]|uniref:hypothetical protein n=1 Tax=Mesorhizobium australicum TaxID=536018 RepID=UPI0033378128